MPAMFLIGIDVAGTSTDLTAIDAEATARRCEIPGGPESFP
jgi:N-methylhydantoinase A/oxoprolinase/acetone carboxylase beta subunit